MISVVVIGKNEGERLAACLKSIQTALNVLAHEVVYVDSCSTDQSLQTAKALGARCFLLAERQTTAGLGRFVGAKEARGEYLLFLDGDMQLCPGFAEKALMAIAAKGYDGVCGIREDVYLRGGEVVDTLYSLIRPPRRRVLFTWVHGITWKDVQDSPTFLEFWPQMASFLQGVTHLVAHNAPFDRRVLEACCQSNGIALPDLPFVCTLRESRRKLKLPSHKLDAVCRYCGIPPDHHHAGSDAIAAARILIYLQGESQGGE